MNPSLTVFVCSTYRDLIDERDAVLDAIRKLQHQHDSMEFFGARANLPIETCLDEVRRSDILVVIVGHLYGSLVPSMNVSFSEAEYAEGYRLGKPCLVYLRDENVPVLPKHMERDPEKLRHLENFKETLKTRHTTASFREPHDLSLRVAADLGRTAQAFEQAARPSEAPLVPPSNMALEPFSEIVRKALDKGASEPELLSAVRQAVASLLLVQGRRRPLVFFSYSRADEALVLPVASGLRDQGIDVLINDEDVQSDDPRLGKISEGLGSADFVALFMSRSSLASRLANEELNVIMSHRMSHPGGAMVLPVLVDDVEVPAILRDVMYFDLRDGDVSAAVTTLAESVHYHTSRKLQASKQGY